MKDDALDKSRKRSLPDDQVDEQAHKVQLTDRVGHEYLAKVVSQHYNAIPERGIHQRLQSEIYRLRSFNNWIKSVLIQTCLSKYHPTKAESSQFVEIAVLDLCCGKGGDLTKWNKAGITRLTGLDIAGNSIEDAMERYVALRPSPQFAAHFECIDCFHEDISCVLKPQESPFDLISCMFAFHYAFEDEKTARQAFRNVSKHLKPNGLFFCTLPCEKRLTNLLERSKEEKSFGNSIYQVEFEDDKKTVLQASANEAEDMPFTTWKYYFTLGDSVIRCPEYTVPKMLMIKLAKEHDLELSSYRPFYEFYERYRTDPYFKNLMIRMKVADPKGSQSSPSANLNTDEWQAASLYAAVVFIKTPASTTPVTPSKKDNSSRSNDEPDTKTKTSPA